MLIEAASTRLALDLFESLRKHKFTATEIRVSFMTKSGSTRFSTFANYEALKDFYLLNYNKLASSRRNPFTTEKRLAQLTPVANKGILIDEVGKPINSSNIDGLCELGSIMSVERFKVTSSSFNYDIEFNCINVSDTFKILEGRSLDLRRNNNRQTGLNRHKNSLTTYITDYQKILSRVNKAFNANLYVDLCYVAIGYVEQSLLLYGTFFALVKERIDSGLRISVLEPRYLKKI